MNFPTRLTQALILASLLSSCAHKALGPRVDTHSGINTHELMKRFGFPKCIVSVAISQEDAVVSAELVGAPHINKRNDWIDLTNMMIPGDELRHVWCNPYQGPGGVDLIGLFRGKHMIAYLHTVFVD